MPRGQRKIAATREDAEKTRKTILRTAEQLFMEYGFRAVSTRQIADACGLTQPALYHYFSDKQQLYVEMLRENMTKTQTALERISRRNESIQTRLKLVVRYLVSTVEHDIGLVVHDIQHELNDEARSTLHKLFQHGLIEQIATIFSDGLNEGILRQPQEGGLDATTAAYLFMSMLSRAYGRPPSYSKQNATTTRLHSHQADIERAENIVNILLFGLVKPGTSSEQAETETD